MTTFVEFLVTPIAEFFNINSFSFESHFKFSFIFWGKISEQENITDGFEEQEIIKEILIFFVVTIFNFVQFGIMFFQIFSENKKSLVIVFPEIFRLLTISEMDNKIGHNFINCLIIITHVRSDHWKDVALIQNIQRIRGEIFVLSKNSINVFFWDLSIFEVNEIIQSQKSVIFVIQEIIDIILIFQPLILSILQVLVIINFW